MPTTVHIPPQLLKAVDRRAAAIEGQPQPVHRPDLAERGGTVDRMVGPALGNSIRRLDRRCHRGRRHAGGHQAGPRLTQEAAVLKYILDTNVVAALMKGRSDRRLAAPGDGQDGCRASAAGGRGGRVRAGSPSPFEAQSSSGAGLARPRSGDPAPALDRRRERGLWPDQGDPRTKRPSDRRLRHRHRGSCGDRRGQPGDLQYPAHGTSPDVVARRLVSARHVTGPSARPSVMIEVFYFFLFQVAGIGMAFMPAHLRALGLSGARSRPPWRSRRCWRFRCRSGGPGWPTGRSGTIACCSSSPSARSWGSRRSPGRTVGRPAASR